jgi:hypothetical protein
LLKLHVRIMVNYQKKQLLGFPIQGLYFHSLIKSNQAKGNDDR